MRDVNQTIIKFDYDKNFQEDDFYISKSNRHVYEFLNKFPKWERNLINIIGEELSGKTHLMNIFLSRNKALKFEASNLKDENLKDIKTYENIILENLTSSINENLLYSLINIVEQDSKYLIITSKSSIVYQDFKLIDLKSRAKSFLFLNIEKPDDELIFAILLKNLSDKQISIDKKLVNYIVKRIDRSYSKIHNFIYKIDQLSLKKKKSIDLTIVKEVLGE